VVLLPSGADGKSSGVVVFGTESSVSFSEVLLPSSVGGSSFVVAELLSVDSGGSVTSSSPVVLVGTVGGVAVPFSFQSVSLEPTFAGSDSWSLGTTSVGSLPSVVEEFAPSNVPIQCRCAFGRVVSPFSPGRITIGVIEVCF